MTTAKQNLPSLLYAATSPTSLTLGETTTTAEPQPQASDTPATRPNILFILTDDQRWDAAGFAGNPIISTPHLDQLAREGVHFRNAFATSAICSASRASIFTGLHERTHRFTFCTPPIRNDQIDASYPVMLRNAGYQTGLIGKFGVVVEPGRRSDMFDYFEELTYYDVQPNSYWRPQPDGTEKHLTDLMYDRSMDFLNGVDQSKPWCLSLSFNAPHAVDSDPRQYFWSPEEDGMYDDVTLPVPRTMADEYFQRSPEFLRNSMSRERFKWRFDEPEKYQRMVRGYYRMITGIDRVIGQLREELERRGEADNTVIIFLSDNGYFLGDRGFAGKWYIYEPSCRVPMLVMDPRLPELRQGAVVGLTTLNVDMAPTILDCAGINTPETMQGHSLLPLARGEAPVDWRQDFFYEHLFDHKKIPKSEGVRTERWTYVKWFEQQPVVEELYDHQADFDEMNNLVANPAYAGVLEQLRQRTEELKHNYGGPYIPWPKEPEPKPEWPPLTPAGKSRQNRSEKADVG